MGRIDWANCPECGIEAQGKSEVVELFGLRNNDGNIMTQSWCRECRSRERSEKRLVKKRGRR